jgi:thiol-disulfide isomerase/thioredoxin
MKSINSFYLLIFLCACYGKSPNLDTGHEGKLIPSMRLLLLDSITYIDTKTWQAGKPIVLIDISPYCPYCRAMTQKLTEENQDLKDIQFILLSTFPIVELNKYSAEYQLKKYPNITIARDYDANFSKYFKSPGVPCIAIYNKEKLLKQVFMGKVNANLIKDIALE